MNRRQFLQRAALLSSAALLTACSRDDRVIPDGSATTPLPSRPATRTRSPATRIQPPAGSPAPTRMAPAVAPSPGPTEPPTSTPAPLATLTPVARDWLGLVALVKATDRAEGVRQAIRLLGINEVRGDRVLLKPNFNSADPAPGSTHPDVLRALVAELGEMGARSIAVGDRSGMGQTQVVMQQIGVFDLAKELGFSTVVYDNLGEKDWALQESKDLHWSRGFAVPKQLLDAEAVVQTCNLKTHRFGGHFTLSLKNSVGFVAKQIDGVGYNYMTELHGSQYQRHMIAEVNQVYKPALVVMDAVEAFADQGPDQGRVVQPGVVLAALDRIALDAVGVAILRMHNTTPQVSQGRIFDLDQIARAVELELGVRRPEDIHIVTQGAEGEAFAQEVTRLLIQ